MRLGWKPVTDVSGAPIPLYYDYETFDLPVNPMTGEQYDMIYMGPRYKHSIGMHKSFANRLLPNNR
jgi:cytosolic carboxypeptidase protein 2/3